MQSKSSTTEHARELRQSQTQAEGLLWSLLRSKQLCGLKFRRQHPVGPFFADFACQSRRVIVELDGDYHDQVQQYDLQRQRALERLGWNVLRFTNADVLDDAEVVLRSIAQQLDLPYSFRKRTSKMSGMMSDNTTDKNA